MAQKFEYVRILGEGSFGKVFLISLSRDREYISKYALKVTNLTSLKTKERQGAVQESSIMKMLNHPHILKYFSSIDVDAALCIVTEYCSNGDLSMFLQNRQLTMVGDGRFLPEPTIVDWFRQLASALEYLHAIPILHRDIKTSNIFLTDDFQTKLGDFGLAKLLETPDSRAKTYCGSIYYMSPEILSGKPYDHKSDIWALGVVMYEILTLSKPFDSLLTYQIVFQILKANLPVLLTNYNSELCNLISTLLSKDDALRPAATEILANEIFKHELQKHNETQHVCSVSKSGRKADQREKYSGPFDMAKILKELSKSHDFVRNIEYSISDILKHVISITKDVSHEDDNVALNDKDTMERVGQNLNQISKQDETQIDKRVKEDNNDGERDSENVETKSSFSSESGLDRFRKRVNNFIKVTQSRSFDGQASSVSLVKCDGCRVAVLSVHILQVKESRYCRACLENGCDGGQSTCNSEEVKCKAFSSKDSDLKYTLQPTNDIDDEKLIMSKPMGKVAQQTTIDKHFERMVLRNVKQAMNSNIVTTSSPVVNQTDFQNEKSESISDDTKERLHFVYQTVERQDKLLDNNHTQSDTDNPLKKCNGHTKTLFNMPKPRRKARDVSAQMETRLAFLSKMRHTSSR